MLIHVIIAVTIIIFIVFILDSLYKSLSLPSVISYDNGMSSAFPNIKFISFAAGDHVHHMNQTLQQEKNIQHNAFFDSTDYLTENTISKNYFTDIAEFDIINSSNKGYKLWTWKAWIILDAMLKCKKNTVIIYLDSGAYFKRSVRPIIEIAKIYGRVFFNNIHTNGPYCKCEVVESEFVTETQKNKFLTSLQLDASCIFIMNTTENIEFVKKWLDLCFNEKLISDGKYGCSNSKSFKEHRHDQALLSLTATKHQTGQTIFSKMYKYRYINHHRRRHIN